VAAGGGIRTSDAAGHNRAAVHTVSSIGVFCCSASLRAVGEEDEEHEEECEGGFRTIWVDEAFAIYEHCFIDNNEWMAKGLLQQMGLKNIVLSSKPVIMWFP
jgi:hypothetical protein